ncbi:hypothetical protein A5906_25655 [Bradyrhizobium sacchari]|nr:hypothetical protein A5906_25655 [Bradyrhizobium sacchari]
MIAGMRQIHHEADRIKVVGLASRPYFSKLMSDGLMLTLKRRSLISGFLYQPSFLFENFRRKASWRRRRGL